MPELDFTEPAATVDAAPMIDTAPVVEPEPQRRPSRASGSGKPEVPGWEDVLLGVRSGSQP